MRSSRFTRFVLALSLGCALALPVPSAATAVGPSPASSTVGESGKPDLTGLEGFLAGEVEERMRRDRIPGAAVVVVSGGRTVLAQGYGVADVATGKPVNAETGFFTGSLAKVFTATAALQLVKAGKLDLDADVNRYLKSFKVEDTYPGRPVTLKHLLTYTAGFDEDLVGLAKADPKDVGGLAESLAERQPRRVRPPGEHVAYDNYGVALAGHLVELASGQPYADYVREHILRPLGMGSTSMAVPHPAELDAALAGAYRPSGAGQTTVRGQYGPWTPSGTGPVTTPADMARFLTAQLADDPRLGEGVPALLRARHHTEHPDLPGMGYVLEQRPRNGRELLFKDGDVPGHHSALALLPESRTGVYVAFNGDGEAGSAPSDAKALIDAFVDRYFPAETTAPTAPEAVEKNASAYAGTYRSLRVSRTSLMKAAALFSSPTVEAHPDGTLTTTALSADPAKETQRWDPEGDGVFRERGGQDRLAFGEDGTLATTMNPSETWTKLPWYASPSLHLALLGLSALALALTSLLTPLTALSRALRHRTPEVPLLSRAASLLTWTAATLSTAFVAGIATAMADPNAVNELLTLNSPRLAVLPPLAATALLTAITATALTLLTPLRRPLQALPLLAFPPFFLILHTYNLLPF
ncbi:serine hydrolase domain-containing protein [Actinocorallia sp. A-T 12471]|uniref:serine hydrolase domain-containing protein n=1 Tax=Actinocorallia sp. A-T 12471 TaxID=3089813 RepID=UPI0029D09B70|nr:serine hydrolase domain-containing protein [Actinocorallia sp. A-T 12471]MDX6738305.1 serine hydrolase domain-containing protein [Actinocorallia sp. A-T 12471]